MNKILKLTALLIMMALLAPNVFAQENRDLWPLSTFIQSAKIQYQHVYKKSKLREDLYVSIDLMRDASARFAHVPEVYLMLGSFFSEINEIDTMVAYFDSLEIYCEDESVDKKYRKKCKDFLKSAADIREDFWQNSYNDGVEYLRQYDTVAARQVTATTEDSIKMLDSLKQVAFDLSYGEFEKAALLKPKDARAFTNIGLLYDREGKSGEAVKYYKKALEIKGEDADNVAMVAYAYIAAEDRNWDTVIVWFEKMLKYKPNDISALTNLSIAYSVKGDMEKSNEYNMKILETDPTNSQALFNAGQSWFIRMQETIDELSEYPDSIPANKPKREEIEARINQCRDSAVSYFDRSIESNPEDTDALRQVGILHLLSGTEEGNQQAADAFARIIEIEPDNSDALDYLGRSHIMLGQFDLAVKPYEKIVENFPGNCEAWETLAELYQYTKQEAKAREAATKAEECNKL